MIPEHGHFRIILTLKNSLKFTKKKIRKLPI